MLSLKEILLTLSPDEMEALRKALQLKPDQAEPTRLLQRLDNSERTRKVFAELESLDKHVLRYVLSQGGRATESELIERLPDAGPSIEKLSASYLLFLDRAAVEEKAWLVPREYVRFVPLTPSEKSTLANLILRQPTIYGEEVAKAHGWASGAKRDQVAALKNHWLDPQKLLASLATLSEPEQALWRLFVDADGIVDTKGLQRSGITPPSVQPGHLDFTRPLDRLYALGLVFPNQMPQPSCFLVPSDILARVKGKVTPKTFSISPSTPADLRTWGLRILTDLQLYAAYQSSGRLQFTQNDIPLRHQLRSFLKAIGVDEEPYGLFLNFSMGALFAKVVRKDSHTLDANPAESMSRLAAYWRESDFWQESSHWRDAHRSSDGQLDKTLKAKRLIVLKALEDLPARQWIPYKEFEEHVFANGWKRVDAGAQANSYYHNDRTPRYHPLMTETSSVDEAWARPARRDFVPDLAAAETLANIVVEGLVWLGLIEAGLGRGRKKGWEITHLRLTDWGQQFLDKKSGRLEPLPPVPTETHFRVLPNLEIHVSPHLKPDLMVELFKIAILKSVNTFALTKESLRSALDDGKKSADLLQFLTVNASAPLPAMVQQFVEEVAQKHGHIKLGIAGAYLEVDDPVLLVELKSQRALADIFRKQIGDRLTILNDNDLERIAKVLRKLGYFPVVEKSPETERLKMKFHW